MTILDIKGKEKIRVGESVFRSYRISLNGYQINTPSYEINSSIKELKEMLKKILNCNLIEKNEKNRNEYDVLLCIYGKEEFIKRVSLILNNTFKGIDKYSETKTQYEINKFLWGHQIFL